LRAHPASTTGGSSFPLNIYPSFTGNHRPFAEYRVRVRRIALNITPSNTTNLLKEIHMHTLSYKLSALAAALVMNTVVLGTLGLLFALQS
jgi:hypothetical protein